MYFGKVLMSIAKSLGLFKLASPTAIRLCKNWAALSVYSLYQSNKWKNGTPLNLYPWLLWSLNSLVFLPIWSRLLFISFLYSSFHSPCSHKMCPSLLSPQRPHSFSSSLSADVWGLTVCCLQEAPLTHGTEHTPLWVNFSKNWLGRLSWVPSHSAATFSRAWMSWTCLQT